MTVSLGFLVFLCVVQFCCIVRAGIRLFSNLSTYRRMPGIADGPQPTGIFYTPKFANDVPGF